MLEPTALVGFTVAALIVLVIPGLTLMAGTPMRFRGNVLVAFLCGAAAAPLSAQGPPADVASLRRLHTELLEAHRTNDLDRWMAVEAPQLVSANGGQVTFPEAAERRDARRAYLESASFEVYRDLREPVIQVSPDGLLGWLIAEVEVRGTLEGESGQPTPFHDIWAWVELYQKIDGAWKLVGNVSNRRPGA